MIISYNWLQSYFKKKLPTPEKLADILTMHSFEVEGVEKIKGDCILDIDILPNRAHDCLSHRGIAKEISALLNIKIRNPKSKARNKSKNQNSNKKLNITIKEPKLCGRYFGRRIEGIKVAPSPKWLKEAIESLGQKSINNIVDATNFVLFDIGQPLHAFDADKLDGGIVVRKAKNGEKMTTLDDQAGVLDESMLVIADSKDTLAIAGIKGGKKAEVDKNTKNIIIEAANFESGGIRKTSRKVGIQTEASLRYEKSISAELVGQGMEQVTNIILDIARSAGSGQAGIKVVSEKDVYPAKKGQTKNSIRFTSEDVSSVLGVEIKEKQVLDILKNLGFGVKFAPLGGGPKGILVVEVPPERLDIEIKEDLIEEVARVYGYENIEPKFPYGALVPPKRNDNFFFGEMTRHILTGLGFTEIYNYSFAKEGKVELENPLDKNKKFMRANLMDGLREKVKENTRYFKKIKFFELGKIFPSSGMETISLAGVIEHSNADFYTIKGVVETLLQKLGITDFYFNDHPHMVAEIRVGNTSIGGIDHNAFEINFEMLVRITEEEIEYRPISKYPSATRDIAIFVPVNTKMVEVLNVIENTAGELLVDTDLFDIYEKEYEGTKSLAFHLIFQAQNKTLSENEINDLMAKIFEALETNVEWEVRK